MAIPRTVSAALEAVAAHPAGPARGVAAVVAETANRLTLADQALGSFTEIFAPSPTAAAAVGPLSGVCVQVKANIAVAGAPHTAASAILEGFQAPRDATVVARLKAAGAVVVGLGNMDEFGMGSSTERSVYGRTHNPWGLEKSPGGSSGGGAAAVAAGLVPLALGTDTGGSVRQPAAFCGVVGFKPTYGRLSRAGVVAYASSLDQVGLIAADVDGVARVWTHLAGADVADSTTVTNAVPAWTPPSTSSLAGRRLAVPRALLAAGGLADDVAASFASRLETLEALGATLVDVDIPGLREAVSAYYVIATAEASSNLSRYDGVRYGPRAGEGNLADLYAGTRRHFGEEVRRRLLLGTFVLSHGYYDAYLKAAQLVRRRLANGLADVLADCDALVMPTTPTTAFDLGEKLEDPLAMYLADVFTVVANLAGLPAISVPSGVSSTSGMPVGFQLVGRAWDEGTLLHLAAIAAVPLTCPWPPPSAA